MNRKYDDAKIIELHLKGLTDREIAEELGVTPNNLATKRRDLGLKPNKSKRDTHELTSEEEEVLIGTLLGDSTLRYVHKDCKYPNLTFIHGVNQKEYFDWVSNKLANLKSSVNEYDSAYIKTNKEIAKRWVYTGKNMKCLKEVYDSFYKEGTKIIPIDYIKTKFTKVSLYCLYMDDGSYDIHTNSFIINTQCFSIENLQGFCELLLKKFNLKFNIKSDHCLYLQHCSNETFKKLMAEINECRSMEYKYDSRRKTPLNRVTPEKDHPVLNPQETEDKAKRLEVMPNK